MSMSTLSPSVKMNAGFLSFLHCRTMAICWAATDNTGNSIRLNSSKHPQDPDWAKPENNTGIMICALSWVSNILDPDQARHYVGPDLGLNCLQRSVIQATHYSWTHQSIPRIQTEPNLKTIPASWYAPCHECQTVWIQIRTIIMSGLIWVQTVCKGNQQYRNSSKHPQDPDLAKPEYNEMILASLFVPLWKKTCLQGLWPCKT